MAKKLEGQVHLLIKNSLQLEIKTSMYTLNKLNAELPQGTATEYSLLSAVSFRLFTGSCSFFIVENATRLPE